MTTRSMQVELVAEVGLTARHRMAIGSLLHSCFPEYPGEQLFYPQPPHFRLLSWNKETLTGHLAGIVRAITVGGKPLTIFGIADLCTDPAWTGQRIGSQLLQRLQELAGMQGIPFLMAMAAEEDFYLGHGFRVLDVPCKWLAFLNGRSLGVFQRRPPSGLMVKALRDQEWPDGEVDLHGPLF